MGFGWWVSFSFSSTLLLSPREFESITVLYYLEAVNAFVPLCMYGLRKDKKIILIFVPFHCFVR
jgi:hypothetical protein